MSTVSPVPEGFHTINVYLFVPNSLDAIAVYEKAFGATLRCRLTGPGGEHSTLHAELQIGDSVLMISDENPQWGCLSPKTLGGSPMSTLLYVPDVDAVFQQCLASGFTAQSPVADMFWGDRMCKMTDPFGHVWGIATKKEDVSEEEMFKRHAKMLAEMCQGESGAQHE